MTSVLLACPGVGHVLRGYERVTLDIARLLRPHLRVHLARGGGDWTGHEPGFRVPCLHREGRLLSALLPGPEAAYTVEQRTFALGTYAAARALDVTHVHLHDPAVMNVLWHARRHLGGRFRIVFTNGGWLSPEHLVRPDVVHCVTPVDEERLLSAGLPAERIRMAPYGIRLPSTTAAPRGGALRVIGVGALTADKGVDTVIRAVAALGGGATLTFLGQRTPETPALERLCADLLGPRGRLLTVAPEDVHAHLVEADVFVLPTRSEGFGMAILEAMAAGLPAVVSDLPVLRWLVGDAGMTVPVGDVEALAARLRGLDGSALKAAGAASRERASALSWERLVPAYVGLYSLPP